jgi:hypothetical protein
VPRSCRSCVRHPELTAHGATVVEVRRGTKRSTSTWASVKTPGSRSSRSAGRASQSLVPRSAGKQSPVPRLGEQAILAPPISGQAIPILSDRGMFLGHLMYITYSVMPISSEADAPAQNSPELVAAPGSRRGRPAKACRPRWRTTHISIADHQACVDSCCRDRRCRSYGSAPA